MALVWVSSSEEEALRDLVRAREALRGHLMRARQRLSKLLLRATTSAMRTRPVRGRRGTARGLSRVDLGGAAQLTLLDYVGAMRRGRRLRAL
jgi:hypothetical protein